MVNVPNMRYVIRKVPMEGAGPGITTVSKVLQVWDLIDYCWVDVEPIPVIYENESNKNEPPSSKR